MSDETSQGLTLQVLCNLIRETDTMSKLIQQHSSTNPDTRNELETPEEVEEDRTIPRAQDALYRLEIESHKIEQLTRILQNNPSQHHVTQGRVGQENSSSSDTTRILPGHHDTRDTGAQMVPSNFGHLF